MAFYVLMCRETTHSLAYVNYVDCRKNENETCVTWNRFQFWQNE